MIDWATQQYATGRPSNCPQERAARIIDPEAWAMIDNWLAQSNYPALRQRVIDMAAPSLAKADAIKQLSMGDIPRAIAEQVLSMGRAHWGATAELTDAGHLEHLAESLRLTREDFNLDDVPVPMHGLYLDGTETVLCHTGTSPNSGANAQALAGAWNWLFDQCAAKGR
jgi:hypothetical protein